MSWMERFKLSFNIFKKIALPLYLWYLIFFGLFFLLMAVLLFIPASQFFMESEFYNEYFHFDINPEFSPMGSHYVNLGLFDSSQGLGGISPSLLALSILLYLLFAALAIVLSSILQAGTFRMVIKGLTSSKASFKDFKPIGLAKMTGWNFFLFGIVLLVVLAGVLFALMMEAITNTFSLFVFIYMFGAFILFIFLMPWLTTGGYYILAGRQESFRTSLGKSWRFFLSNMSSLWGALLAMFLLNIIIAIIEEFSSSIGGILSFLATPLSFVIPIIWVLTLMQEKEGFIIESTGDSFAEADEARYDDSWLADNASNEHDYYTDNHNYADAGNDRTENNSSPKGSIDSQDDYNYYNNGVEGDNNIPGSLSKQNSLQSKDNTDSDINFCPTCGSIVRSNHIYCSKCGTKIR